MGSTQATCSANGENGAVYFNIAGGNGMAGAHTVKMRAQRIMATYN